MIHELATNAAKYGALSSPAGRVGIRWSVRAKGETPQLHFMWQERGGPPVAKPSHKGFGTVLLEHAVAGIDSAPQIDFAPGGLTYQTDTPLTMLTPTTPCQADGPEATSTSTKLTPALSWPPTIATTGGDHVEAVPAVLRLPLGNEGGPFRHIRARPPPRLREAGDPQASPALRQSTSVPAWTSHRRSRRRGEVRE